MDVMRLCPRNPSAHWTAKIACAHARDSSAAASDFAQPYPSTASSDHARDVTSELQNKIFRDRTAEKVPCLNGASLWRQV